SPRQRSNASSTWQPSATRWATSFRMEIHPRNDAPCESVPVAANNSSWDLPPSNPFKDDLDWWQTSCCWPATAVGRKDCDSQGMHALRDSRSDPEMSRPFLNRRD